MVITEINAANLDEYDLFCKKSKKSDKGYQNKLKWIKERFKEGLRFKLLLVKELKGMTSRGFIEYIPGKYNWRGINADGWMVIHCLWVVGKHKKKGHGSNLVKECINDAKELGMYGVVAMTAKKKGWLPTEHLFLKLGFQKVDQMEPYFEIYALPFSNDVSLPQFRSVFEDTVEKYPSDGITILDSHQCPYIQNTINAVGEYAQSKNIPFRVLEVENCKEISIVHPYGTYCILWNGGVLSYKPGNAKETVDLIKSKVQND